jgi:hypothetical protein
MPEVDPIEKLSAAREFADGQTETEILLVRETEDGPNVGKMQIDRSVQNELSNLFSKSLTTIIDKLRDGETIPRELDVANTVTGNKTLQVAPVDELPQSDLSQVLISRDNHGTTSYLEKPKPKFQMIRISEPGGKILAGVQSYHDYDFIQTDDEVAIWYNNEEYAKFDSDLLVIKPKLNSIYYDNWVFVNSPSTFEQMFEMREEYEQRAEEALDGFEESGIQFEEAEKTKDWLTSQMGMLRGMHEIHDNNIHERATPETVEQIIRKYELDERFSINYERHNGEIQLGVDEYTDTYKLLKLLAAKYAEDEIMETQWEIDSGQRL